MTDRRVLCPQCRHEIRLASRELAEKRGFCALCDASFELLREMLVGDGPMRQVAVARPQLVVGPPPSVRLREESPSTIFLRPSRSTGLVMLGFSAIWWSVLIVWYVNAFGEHASLLHKLFPLGHLAAGLFVLYQAFWGLGGWERVELAGIALHVKRGIGGVVLSTHTTFLDGSVQLAVREEDRGKQGTARHLSVISPRDPVLKIGKGLGLDCDELAWLEAAVRRRLSAARASRSAL